MFPKRTDLFQLLWAAAWPQVTLQLLVGVGERKQFG